MDFLIDVLPDGDPVLRRQDHAPHKDATQESAKPTKEKHSMPLTVRLAPEVYEGLRRLDSRTGGGASAAATPETALIRPKGNATMLHQLVLRVG